jgi:molybdate transport system substrate-binding protein
MNVRIRTLAALFWCAATLGAAHPRALAETSAGDAAESLRVAVAANFRAPFEAITADYPADDAPISFTAVYGSSGLLAAQISQGAAFDLFLSADRTRPFELIDRGRAIGPVVTYAIGRVALWTPGRTPDPALVLTERVAIANPELAPYGLAARQCLEQLGYWTRLVSPPVLGTSISQAFHFVATGAVGAGFVAESSLREQGVDLEHRWLCPPDAHEPIAQGAVVLRESTAARAMLAWLTTTAVQRQLAGFGYVPIEP